MESYNDMSLGDLHFALGVLERKGDIEELKRAKKIYEDRSLEMMVKQEKAYENTKYKTVLYRIIAAITDAIFISLFLYILMKYAFGIELFDNSERTPFLNTMLSLSPYIYSIAFHAIFGKTIGKMFSGIKVVKNTDETKISVTQAFLRDCIPFILVVIYAIPALSSFYIIILLTSIINILWPVLEIVTTLTNKKRRALHDFIAGTVVIIEK